VDTPTIKDGNVKITAWKTGRKKTGGFGFQIAGKESEKKENTHAQRFHLLGGEKMGADCGSTPIRSPMYIHLIRGYLGPSRKGEKSMNSVRVPKGVCLHAQTAIHPNHWLSCVKERIEIGLVVLWVKEITKTTQGFWGLDQKRR